jgi:hypothetical protein
MAKISTAELKRVVIEAEKNRLQTSNVRIDRARHPRLLSAERAGDEFLSEFFRSKGFDEKRFAALRKQHRAELDRVIEQEDADAIRRSARANRAVQAQIKSQTAALKQLRGSKPFFPFPLVTLDTPFLIWATPRSNIISDSSIEPFNSWAKVRVESSDSEGTHKLSFYYLWDNPSDFFAVINGSTFMGATGRLKASVSGGLSGIDPTSRFSFVWCSVNFALWSWWQQPPTSTPYTTHSLASVAEDASFWDKSEAVSVADGFNLDQTHFLVPPQGVVVFEVTLQISYSNGDGKALADFESGDFRVTCPVVVVALLTGSLTNAFASA